MASMMVGGMEVIESGNTGDIEFATFIERLKNLQRSAVVRLATEESWSIWATGSSESETEDRFVTRVEMPTVAVLALAICDDGPSRMTPTRSEVIALGTDLLNVRSPISDDGAHQSELESLRSALLNSQYFKKVAPKPGDLRAVYAFLTAAREIRAQWAFRTTGPAGLARAWALAQGIEKAEPGFLAHFESEWGATLREVLLSVVALLNIAGSNNPTLPGAFSLNVPTPETTLCFGIPVARLQKVASRLSTSASFFPGWFETASQTLHATSLKFLPQPLAITPFVEIEASREGPGLLPPAFVAPSPSHMMWRAQSIVLDVARVLNQTNNRMNDAIGAAVASYVGDFLRALCGPQNVVNLDEVFGSKDKSHADFAVLVGTTAILVESKTSIGGAMNKSVISPGGYVTTWSRIWHAYLQCVSTSRAAKFKTHPVFSAVTDFIHIATFEEHLCVESGALNAIAVHDGLFKEERFACAEALTVQEFEDALVIYGPEGLADEISFKWQSRKFDQPLGTYLRTRPTPKRPFSDRSYSKEIHLNFFKSTGVLDAMRATDQSICASRAKK